MAQSISWLILLGISIVVFTGLFFIRRTFYRFIPRELQIADLLPPVLILNLHVLSFQTTGWSVFPYLMITWLTLLLAFVIYRGFITQSFRFRKDMLTYWRFSTLVLPIIYIIFLVINLLK
ncbi:DUF3397 family protein [Periweissella fabalis]|uniref:DUF3397 domain-containing protein n=1 Tax=Periweissella fabalis TaxID=1070421 RepID=A0A7X6S2P7_9LACO|nr:DUF3397 family protein [Periweissella fabalis]NKZ24245.1 DUF3397 domain-containing protein [Periweissella fabalis]